eukprot:7356246-Prymnesium_polylepis.1
MGCRSGGRGSSARARRRAGCRPSAAALRRAERCMLYCACRGPRTAPHHSTHSASGHWLASGQ